MFICAAQSEPACPFSSPFPSLTFCTGPITQGGDVLVCRALSIKFSEQLSRHGTEPSRRGARKITSMWLTATASFRWTSLLHLEMLVRIEARKGVSISLLGSSLCYYAGRRRDPISSSPATLYWLHWHLILPVRHRHLGPQGLLFSTFSQEHSPPIFWEEIKASRPQQGTHVIAEKTETDDPEEINGDWQWQ